VHPDLRDILASRIKVGGYGGIVPMDDPNLTLITKKQASHDKDKDDTDHHDRNNNTNDASITLLQLQRSGGRSTIEEDPVKEQ
jgi:hypothetical protein